MWSNVFKKRSLIGYAVQRWLNVSLLYPSVLSTFFQFTSLRDESFVFFALCPIFFGIIKNFVWINYINKDSHSEIAFLINFYYFFLMIKFSCKLHTFHITRIIYFLFCIFYKCYKYKMIRSHKYLKLMEFINIYMFFDWST